MPSRITFCLFLTLSMCLAADHGDSDLKMLYESHQWFKLRETVRGSKAPAFYQGAVACAFGDLQQARKEFKSVTESAPKSEQAYEAHNMLAYLYYRTGQYRQALGQIDKMLAIKPDKASDQAGRKLFAALSQAPEQSVTKRQLSRMRYEVKIGNPFVPLSVNGNSAKYMLDTGANISTMSESEAKRVGLAFHKVAAGSMKVSGAAGAQVGNYRIAVADRLSVGNIQLRNVAFLVIPENQGPWTDLQPGERGALGIQVLQSFQTVRFSQDGAFEIGFPPNPPNAHPPNLCFHDAQPIVEAEFQSSKLQLVLDTGAEETHLSARFAKEFASLLKESGKQSTKDIHGVGGSKQIEALTLPELKLHLGGFDALLRPAQVLLNKTTSESEHFHGLLGWDLLHQAHRVTLDFGSMTLALEYVP